MHETTTDKVLSEALRTTNSEATAAVLKNPDLFAFLLASFNNTVKLASGKPADIALGLASKTLATSKFTAKATSNSGLEIGTTAAQVLLETAKLVTVASRGPGSAVVAIGAAFAKKTSLALGLVGKEDKRAKCMAALTDLAASGLTTALVVPSAATGIGTVVLAGSVAQLILSGYQTYQACRPDEK